MFKNYITTALRNIGRDRTYAFINIIGLAIGTAVFLQIAHYVWTELNYDRFFPNAERIHRVATHLTMGDRAVDMTSTFPPLAEAVRTSVPEVESATHFIIRDGKLFKKEEKIYLENQILYTNAHFFEVFDIPLIAGNAKEALKAPDAVILTPEMAEKYFGKRAVIGESIKIDGEDFRVTGVIEKLPSNAHFHFKAICSIANTFFGKDKTWDNINVSTYVRMKPNVNPERLAGKVDQVIENNTNQGRGDRQGMSFTTITQPLTSIHLYSDLEGEQEPNSSITYVYILAGIGLIILLLACINYINLSTAIATRRAKEVGIRKAMGSTRQELIWQFGIEAIVMAAVAVSIAVASVYALQPAFNQWIGKEINYSLWNQSFFMPALVLFTLLLGSIAGGYPAFYLANFQPTEVLRGNTGSSNKGGSLRNVLVVGQFMASIVLITCTLIAWQQLNFLRSKRLGFDKENVIVIENANKLGSIEAFKNELEQSRLIQKVGASQWQPVGENFDGTSMVSELDRNTPQLVNILQVDYDYVDALKLEVQEGRNFSREFPADNRSILLNERAAKLFGLQDPVGKRLYPTGDTSAYTIAGIVSDFNFESLKKEIAPVIFFLNEKSRYLITRLEPGNPQDALTFLEKTWNAQQTGMPFTYTFLDDAYNALYQSEVRNGNLFGIFTGLSIFIACMGLLGLAAYAVERRRKEVGIRKVLGAKVSDVLFLLSKDFLGLVLIAALVAIPIAWWATSQWLADFAYRISLQWWMFALAGAAALGIALLTVIFQALRAAISNPVESLRAE